MPPTPTSDSPHGRRDTSHGLRLALWLDHVRGCHTALAELCSN
jgi:hypothetical protein